MEEGQRRRVLVVDDDVKLGNLIARALKPEHDVFVLTNGREALNHIERGARFDLVLCDLMLPGLSGMDFYEQLGSIAPELVEHVVFLNGGAFTPRATAFLEQTNIVRLDKPFRLEELRQVVRDHSS